jgi:pimeloyl-ACP methyl ester carboxylesterase
VAINLSLSRRTTVTGLVVSTLLLIVSGSSFASEYLPQQTTTTDSENSVDATLNPTLLIPPTVAAKPDRHHLEPVKCWFTITGTAPKTECFRMYVPENHALKTGRTINFPVIKLSVNFGVSAKTPVLHLGGGGPGNPMGFNTSSINDWLWDWYQQMSVGDYRDLYLIDPRGVGLAEPVLVCSEYIPAFLESIELDLTVEEEINWNTDINKKCMARLNAEGIELATYNSLSVARDVELLRRSLGIEKWNLYGVSYGSRYALTLAREYPQTIESMVLDAAVFPNVRYMDNYATNLSRAFDRLIQYCLDSEPCHNALPEAERRFWDMVQKLEDDPVHATIRLPQQQHSEVVTEVDLVLNADRFLSVFYNALYDAEQFQDLPAILTSLENNELGKFEQNILDWLAFQTDDDYGDASAAAHYCYEESPFIDYDKAIREAHSLRRELRESAVALIKFNREQCARWPVPAADPVEGEPVVTNIPTLILHGALDPVLPVENIRQQLQNFSAVDYEIFADMSHSIVGVHPCGEPMASAFYNYKLAFRTHISCLDDIQP